MSLESFSISSFNQFETLNPQIKRDITHCELPVINKANELFPQFYEKCLDSFQDRQVDLKSDLEIPQFISSFFSFVTDEPVPTQEDKIKKDLKTLIREAVSLKTELEEIETTFEGVRQEFAEMKPAQKAKSLQSVTKLYQENLIKYLTGYLSLFKNLKKQTESLNTLGSEVLFLEDIEAKISAYELLLKELIPDVQQDSSPDLLEVFSKKAEALYVYVENTGSALLEPSEESQENSSDISSKRHVSPIIGIEQHYFDYDTGVIISNHFFPSSQQSVLVDAEKPTSSEKQNGWDLTATYNTAVEGVTALYNKAVEAVGFSSQESLMQELKTKFNNSTQLTEQDLNTLNQYFLELKNSKKDLEKEPIQQLQNYIETFLSSNVVAKPAIEALAFTLGFAVGGFLGALGTRLIVAKVLESISPSSESYAITIASSLSQSLGAYVMNGTQGLLLNTTISFFENQIPLDIQATMCGGLTTYLTYSVMASFPLSLTVGLLSALAYKNSEVFKEMYRDLKHSWKVIKESPLKIAPYILMNTFQHASKFSLGLFNAIWEKRHNDYAARIAAIAITGIAIYTSLWTLPLSLVSFYMINKTFHGKYEGIPELHNNSFRDFVIETFNNSEVKNIKTFRSILEQENFELKESLEAFEATLASKEHID